MILGPKRLEKNRKTPVCPLPKIVTGASLVPLHSRESLGMDRYWEDDSILAPDGRIGRLLRVGWDDDQADLEPPVRTNFIRK